LIWWVCLQSSDTPRGMSPCVQAFLRASTGARAAELMHSPSNWLFDIRLRHATSVVMVMVHSSLVIIVRIDFFGL